MMMPQPLHDLVFLGQYFATSCCLCASRPQAFQDMSADGPQGNVTQDPGKVDARIQAARQDKGAPNASLSGWCSWCGGVMGEGAAGCDVCWGVWTREVQ